MENRFAVLVGGIVVSLLICYYLNRELTSTRTRVNDMERAVTMHHQAFESLQGNTNDTGDDEEVEEITETDVKQD